MCRSHIHPPVARPYLHQEVDHALAADDGLGLAQGAEHPLAEAGAAGAGVRLVEEGIEREALLGAALAGDDVRVALLVEDLSARRGAGLDGVGKRLQ